MVASCRRSCRCVAAGAHRDVDLRLRVRGVTAAAGCGGVREGRGWVQGRVAVGFAFSWKVVLNHSCVGGSLLVE